jgi:hypothetical protein
MNIETIIKEEFNRFIGEETISPSEIPNTKVFWHGGNLENYNDDEVGHKSGRHEFGFGLYLTTHYGTAQKYSKGSRKLYMVTVSLGNEINDSLLDLEACKTFINQYIVSNKRKELILNLESRSKDGKVKAYIFNNSILNNDAIKSSNGIHLRKFLVSNGIDYDIVDNAFGWGEEMMVLYNMKKIVNVKRINPKDEIEKFDLH